MDLLINTVVNPPDDDHESCLIASKILIKVKEGIESEPAKKIVQRIKDGKLKVQASIQDSQVRVTGKNRDDLQAAMQAVRAMELDMELQFVNFRE